MTASRVVVETTDKKSFASMLDWPGWSRSGKTETGALDVLRAYEDRYRQVINHAGLQQLHTTIEIIDRLPGNGQTSFGVPGQVHQADYQPASHADAERLISILDACWTCFEDVRGRVSPELKKGPRGGGRDRDEIVAHVVEADRGYARSVGVQTPPFDPLDKDARRLHTEAVRTALMEHRDGKVTGKAWPMRYVVRRMGWHILDHAWEMEDKDLS